MIVFKLCCLNSQVHFTSEVCQVYRDACCSYVYIWYLIHVLNWGWLRYSIRLFIFQDSSIKHDVVVIAVCTTSTRTTKIAGCTHFGPCCSSYQPSSHLLPHSSSPLYQRWVSESYLMIYSQVYFGRKNILSCEMLSEEATEWIVFNFFSHHECELVWWTAERSVMYDWCIFTIF